VTESLTAIPEKPSAGTAARIGWAVLILATLYVCYFSHLGAIGFVGPDEPRYAWIARDMAETGDWVTPRLYGKPWFEKPPLFYWGAALSFKLFGVSEAAARLPSAISALLATLSLSWLALRLYGAETARWLLLLLPTTVGMIGFSHAAATDMPFSGMLTIAMVCAAVILGLTRNENSPILPRTPWLALILFGFFLGLAVLAKGPAAIILSGGAVFFWALFTKRWRDTFRLLHPAAIAAFCLTALPWYILCARRNPDFFRIFIIEHNFKRFLTPEFQHIQPFWYYGLIVLLALIPWIALLLPLCTDLRRFWRAEFLRRPSVLLFLCWAGFTVLFFSVSKSKLPGYVLPAIPPIVLLLAEACRHLKEDTVQVQRWTGALFACTILGLMLGIFRVAGWNFSKLEPNADVYYPTLDRLPLCVLLVGGVLVFRLVVKGRNYTAFQLGVGTLLLALLTFFSSSMLSLEDLSARRFAKPPGRTAQKYLHGEVAYYELQRSYQYALSFYLHEELTQWSQADTDSRWVFTDFKNTQDARKAGLACNTPVFIVKNPIVICENPKSAAGRPSGGQSK
jgi:4-amino-4-deoxy-L-arabinose transferase-like glycosyltransferase